MTFIRFSLHAYFAPVFSLVLCCATSIGHAAESDAQSGFVMRNNASLRLGLERLTLPGDEKMGMLGTTYLIEVAPHVYMGPAAYSSVTGQRGGFYTVGGELEWRQKLVSNISLEAGAYVGGGGGGSSLVGGGLMLRPHADLMWDFGGYRAGISASNVRFPNGHVHSNQIGLVVDFDTHFLHTGFGYTDQDVPVNGRTGVGFDRAIAFFGAYKPSKSATLLSGAPLQNSIGYVGTRMERMITPHFFVGLEAAGANTGGVAGYAEFLGTAGAEMPLLDNRLTVGTRVALGTGGGGSVSVGGGVLVKAGVYATANLTRNFHISVEGGVADSPQGNFRATYETLGLHWNLDHPYSAGAPSKLVANEWVAGTQHYIKAARKDGTVQNMDVFTLKLNRYVTESLYLTGQAHSAYAGQAGGYSVGLIGAGYRTSRSYSGWYAGAELLAGAAGGGSVDTSGGIVVQPLMYAGVGLSKSISARLSAGRIISQKGELNSNVVELGLSYAFGTTRRE
ncbi:MAG TPA: hypothetical protein VIF82_07225 [Burkholderiaceae bacterium]|jgi:hypothetical protein